MRKLSIAGNTAVFKTPVKSKVVHLALVKEFQIQLFLN